MELGIEQKRENERKRAGTHEKRGSREEKKQASKHAHRCTQRYVDKICEFRGWTGNNEAREYESLRRERIWAGIGYYEVRERHKHTHISPFFLPLLSLMFHSLMTTFIRLMTLFSMILMMMSSRESERVSYVDFLSVCKGRHSRVGRHFLGSRSCPLFCLSQNTWNNNCRRPATLSHGCCLSHPFLPFNECPVMTHSHATNERERDICTVKVLIFATFVSSSRRMSFVCEKDAKQTG